MGTCIWKDVMLLLLLLLLFCAGVEGTEGLRILNNKQQFLNK